LHKVLLLACLAVLISAKIKHVGYDSFGLAMIYPTASYGRTWTLNMNEPCKDGIFSPKVKITKKMVVGK